jgi:AraC family transcriptional regulator
MNEYEGRINRVVDHIAAHLDDRLSLAELAKIAAFSPFHFHRVFTAMTGETVHEFVQRLRLEKAAGLLRTRPHASVTEIALECGFASSAGFARAFRARFGRTATAWRATCDDPQLRKIGQALPRPGKAPEVTITYLPPYAPHDAAQHRRKTMHVDIRTMPAWHVAYVRHFGSYGAGVQEAWEKLARWAGPRGLLGPQTTTLGLAHDDPHVTPPGKCRYDACVPVPPGTAPEREIGIADIPAGTAAVLRFAGSREQIPAAYDALYGKWLPQSGYQPTDSPCYELYEGNPEVRPGHFEFDICMLVKPL